MAWLDVLMDRIVTMGRSALQLVPNLAVAAIVFVLFLLLARLVRGAIERVGRRLGKRPNVGIILGRLARWLLAGIGVLVAITIVVPSFRFGTLIQTLGLAGVAVGFAFRDVFQNFFAGILVLWNEPFRVGDQIVYKSFEGTIEEIQTRATFLRTYDGRRVVLPNFELFANPVVVNTAFEHRRVESEIRIGVSEDVDRAKEVILATLGALDEVLRDPAPDVIVTEVGEGAITLRARWWIRPPRRSDLLETRDEVLTRVARSLIEHGIDLPLPTIQILFHDQTGEAGEAGEAGETGETGETGEAGEAGGDRRRPYRG